MSTTIPRNPSGPIPGAMSGRRLSAAAAMAGPVLTIRCVRSTAMNKRIAATPAVVPISTKRMSRVEARAYRPECASLCIGPTVAADCPDDAQIPQSDDEEREANHGARHPGVGVSSCFARGPKDHCKKEHNREYDLGGLQVVGRVLPVCDDAVREYDLKGEHE